MQPGINSANTEQYRRALDELTQRPRTWLITGVAGFIGSNLLEQLLDLGQTVIGVDNFSTGYQANIDNVLEARVDEAASFRMIRGDIRDPEVCRAACAGVDIVLHQAAIGSMTASLKDPVATNDVNVGGFLNVLVAARDAGVSRVVYASSRSVYGDNVLLPHLEERVGRPLSPYAATMRANEVFADLFHRVFGLESIGLRYFNVFGRRQDAASECAAVIPRWIGTILDGAPCRIFGDGEASYDFCYVANAVQANILAATAPVEAANEVYNIACGTSTTLNELFRMIRLGLAGFTRTIAADPIYEAVPHGGIRRSLASIEKARHQLGYEPAFSMSEGLSETLAWYLAGGQTRHREEVLAGNLGDGAWLEPVG
jgi:UDP-N-acetylglucosamine 4-epimerase